MKLPLQTIVLLMALLPSTMWAAQENKTVVNPEIEQILKQHNFNGTVLVAKDKLLVHHHSYGKAVIGWDILNTSTTKFRIASLSKTFTATLIMKMVEDCHLALNKTVNEYLPEFPSQYSTEITIKQLLTHRSGIPRLFKIPDWSIGISLAPISKTEFLSMIARMPHESEPGSAQLYYSANYYILGAIVEKVTGKAFGTVLYETILHPLNLKDTAVYPKGQLVRELANAYKPVNGQYSHCPDVTGDFCSGIDVNLALFVASGPMHSTTKDLLIWLAALEKDVLIDENSKSFLFNAESGAGWNSQIVEFAGNKHRKILTSDGQLEGNSSMLISVPHEKLSIILLNNTGMTYQRKAAIALKIINRLLKN